MKKDLTRKAVLDLEAYTPGEQPKDKSIIKLNTNENAYPPSRKVEQVLTGPVDRLRLYPDPVCMELRERIAEIYNCSVDQVFVGNGSDEILALCIRAFCEKDGFVGYFEPSYSLYPVLAAIYEMETRPIRLPDDFSWTMEEDYEASLFFLANPNAPTSILYPKKTVRAFCEGFSGVVLIDEAYVDFSRENCMDLALSMENVIVSRTLSKSFSLAGLRLGYAIGPKVLMEAFYKIKDSYNVSRLAQDIALAALSDLGHMESNVDRIRQTREKVSGELEKLGFVVFPSETNFLWTKPPEGKTAEGVFNDLREKKILVRYFPGELTGDYLRITVATDGEMRALVDALRGC